MTLFHKEQILRLITIQNILPSIKAANILIDKFHDGQIEKWYRDKVLQQNFRQRQLILQEVLLFAMIKSVIMKSLYQFYAVELDFNTENDFFILPQKKRLSRRGHQRIFMMTLEIVEKCGEPHESTVCLFVVQIFS